MTTPPKEYPTWICHACGIKYGRGKSDAVCGSVATYHMDTCGICYETKPCTQPLDFGHLKPGSLARGE